MVSPASATSNAPPAGSTGAAPPAPARSGSVVRENGGPSRFAAVLAGGGGESRAGGGPGHAGAYGAFGGEVGPLGPLGPLGLGGGTRAGARGVGAGARGPASSREDDGALDGSAEARAEGVDADEAVDGAGGDRGARGATDDALSPWTRHCQQLTAPSSVASPALALALPPANATREASEAPVQAARTSLEELMPALVKKVAWSGDGTRGAVRLEIGAGSLAGGTLLVQAEGSRVRVQLDAPAGTDAASWQREIRTRLEARGLEVDDVEVS